MKVCTKCWVACWIRCYLIFLVYESCSTNGGKRNHGLWKLHVNKIRVGLFTSLHFLILPTISDDPQLGFQLYTTALVKKRKHRFFSIMENSKQSTYCKAMKDVRSVND